MAEDSLQTFEQRPPLRPDQPALTIHLQLMTFAQVKQVVDLLMEMGVASEDVRVNPAAARQLVEEVQSVIDAHRRGGLH